MSWNDVKADYCQPNNGFIVMFSNVTTTENTSESTSESTSDIEEITYSGLMGDANLDKKISANDAAEVLQKVLMNSYEFNRPSDNGYIYIKLKKDS